MTRRSVLPVFLAALLSLIVSSLHAEVLFGPVTVPNGQVYTGTFPMYCRCTSYFLEVTSQSSKTPTVILNGEQVLQLGGEEWRKAAVQVELREDAPNEIEIRVGRTQGRAGATVQVVERDVTPAPMPAREYVKDSSLPEGYSEMFVLNHWASRFVLRVENGDPDGSHRVTSGSVWVNGQVVVGSEQLHGGMAEADAEVELRTGPGNRVRVRVEGPAGAKIRLGIGEPAQTVTVTEVWDMAIPMPFGGDQSGIQMHNGHVLLRMAGGNVSDIDEAGIMTVRLDPEHPRLGDETHVAMSSRGSYVWTRAFEGNEHVCRLYDRDWNLVHETRGEARRVQQVAETGDALLGRDPETASLPPCQGGMIAVYTRTGEVGAKIPLGVEPGDFDVFTQFSSDGLTCVTFCNGNMQVWGTDGVMRWESPWRQSRDLGDGGIAVQGTADSLLFHSSEGTIVRRVVNARPSSEEGRARTTPDGVFGMQLGASVMVARRQGPQSCWQFDPGEGREVLWAWMTENGLWVLAVDKTPYPDPQSVWLLGAGGHVVWETLAAPCPRRTVLTEQGEYFYLMCYDEVTYGKRCAMYRVTVE